MTTTALPATRPLPLDKVLVGLAFLLGTGYEWFELINAGRRYTAVGNSDSHRLVYQWAGYPRTYVRVEDDRPSIATDSRCAAAGWPAP